MHSVPDRGPNRIVRSRMREAACPLVAQNRADRAERLEVWMMVHHDHLGRLFERRLDRRFDHVVALLELLATWRTATFDRKEVGVRAREPWRPEAFLDEQHPHLALVQRGQRL